MSAALDHLLALQAENGGALSVERYVREALYHPEFGYYARNIRTVGRRGDFATSASLGEALATGIARWLWTHRPAATSWHVIEAGAGTGELARTVLRRLGPWRRRGLTYHIVETSPVLREEQRRALPQFRVRWHESIADALAASTGCAVIFSNELIDAFPCRVFERTPGGWTEVGVRIADGRISECAVSRDLPPSSALTDAAAVGERVEVHVSAAEWLASWAGAVRAARMLTIDYGDTMPGLYHRRPRGSLRAYFHHQRYDGAEIYHRFGRQDITADVNFTDLRAWTERLGWQTAALVSQAEFLAAHGAVRSGLHDAELADHTGAGGAFKVLESVLQRKADSPTAPRSFAARLGQRFALPFRQARS